MNPLLLILLSTIMMEVSSTMLAAVSGATKDDDIYEMLARVVATIDKELSERDGTK